MRYLKRRKATYAKRLGCVRLELLAYSFVLSNMVLMQAGLGHNYYVFMNAFFESINAMSTIISLSGRSICVGRLEL